uniref:LAM_G_DOMAIN domain-containing protein n=1 Tax=Macrostomum lignano TaxID=282301 RepID=A0A1I8GH88_9PLAT
SLKAELTAICSDGGLAQLATFNSSSALQNFVEKSQRTLVGTGLKVNSKTPLNLTQPVRIGLLHDRLTGSIFYLSNSKGELELKPLVDSSNLYYNVRPTSSRFSCGSLRLAQTADGTEVSFGVVEFVSCSESLPALLSFRDTARNCCCGCSARAVLSQIESADSQATPSETPPSSAASVTPSGTSSTKTTASHRFETTKAEKVTPPSDSTDACRKSTDVSKRESYNFFIPFVIVLILLVLVINVFQILATKLLFL